MTKYKKIKKSNFFYNGSTDLVTTIYVIKSTKEVVQKIQVPIPVIKGGFYLVGSKTCCFFWNFFLGKYDTYENEISASCRVQFIEATQFFWG